MNHYYFIRRWLVIAVLGTAVLIEKVVESDFAKSIGILAASFVILHAVGSTLGFQLEQKQLLVYRQHFYPKAVLTRPLRPPTGR
jgi:hypothetical protein